MKCPEGFSGKPSSNCFSENGRKGVCEIARELEKHS